MADYPISNVPRRVQYVNSGVGPYAFAFEVLTQTDIAVYRGSTLLTLTTDYTVTINANGTGSVTLVAAGTGNITIVGARAIQRSSDYTTGGDLFASTLNTDLDSQTIFSQQLAEDVDLSIKVPVYAPSATGLTVNPEANKVLGWDSTGANLINIDAGTLATIATYATAYADVFVSNGSTVAYTLTRNPGSIYNLDISTDGVTQEPIRDYTLSGSVVTFTSAMPINSRIVIKYKEGLPNESGDSQDIRYVPAGSGAVTTTVQTKLRETVSVKDFGAVGDGVTDDTVAIQAALNSSALSVTVPNGTYKITATLTIGSNKSFVLSDGATITALATDLGTDPATSGPGIFPGFPRGYPMITNDDYVGGNQNIIIEGGNWIFTRDISIRAGAIVDFRTVTKGQVRNLNCDCPGTGLYTNSVGTIYALQCYYVSVLNCSVENSVGCHNFYFNETWWSKISGCSAKNTNDSTYTVDASPFCQVLNSYAYESAGSAISFNSKYGLVQGNTIDNSGPVRTIPGVGIGIVVGHPDLIWSGSHTKVIGNTIWGHAKSSAISIAQSPSTQNVVVANNTVEGIAGGPPSGNITNGISLVGENTSVTGNQIRNCVIGIRVAAGSSGNSITGNVVFANYRQGILVLSGRNTITGNTCYDNGQSGTAATAIGISLEDTTFSKNNVVNGNTCYDTGSNIQKVGINLATNVISNFISTNSCTGHTDADIFVASAGNLYLPSLLGSVYTTSPVQAVTVLDNTGTPSVLNAGPVVETGGTTSITDLLKGYRGQIVTIQAEHSVTVVNSTLIYLNGGTNFNMTSLDTLTLVRRGAQWLEVARSVN